MNRRLLIGAALVVGFASLAYANTQFETFDKVGVRVFGTLGTNEELSCGNGASARNTTALTRHAIIRVSCKDSGVRLKQGDGTVTAGATDPFLEAGVPEYFNTKGHTHIACRGDGAAAKCTVTLMSAPTD